MNSVWTATFQIVIHIIIFIPFMRKVVFPPRSGYTGVLFVFRDFHLVRRYPARSLFAAAAALRPAIDRGEQ